MPEMGSKTNRVQMSVNAARKSAPHGRAKKKMVPSDPIPSLAHHGHATVLSIAFRSAVRLACLLTGNRFGGYRFNAFRRAAAYHSETGPFARNGLSLARNGFRFHGLHSGVNGPGLLLRYLALRFKCPFGLSAPLPELVCPNPRNFPAAGPLHSLPANSSGCSLRLHSPLGIFAPSGSKRSMGVAAVRPAFRIRPISARSPQPVLLLG